MNTRENRTKMTIGTTCLLVLGACVAPAGQKGLGDATGIAQGTQKPAIVSLSGTVDKIKVGPCEHTTGKADIGFHLILQTEDGKKLNLHVGPADALKDVRDRISIGQSVGAKVYRTEAMPADAYITQTLTVGEEAIAIRDDDLRPVWAAGGGDKQQRGKGQDRKRGAIRRAR